jgi:uncharacterized protein (DUF1800 family)
LSAVAHALVDAQEAWSVAPEKFKRPYEFLVSSYRAVGAVPTDVGVDVIQPLTELGERPMAAPQPNGWSEQAVDWAAPDAIVKRLAWASRFGAANAPAEGAPTQIAENCLGSRLSPATRTAISRAETRPEALALLLMSPEFQRR